MKIVEFSQDEVERTYPGYSGHFFLPYNFEDEEVRNQFKSELGVGKNFIMSCDGKSFGKGVVTALDRNYLVALLNKRAVGSVHIPGYEKNEVAIIVTTIKMVSRYPGIDGDSKFGAFFFTRYE